MAPKSFEKMVVRSTRKVVESSVQVSVVSSNNKRATRRKKDTQKETEEVSGVDQEDVRVIPVENGEKEEQKGDILIEPHHANVDHKEEVKKAKTQKGQNGKKEKRKTKKGRKSVEGYQRYVYRVLKQVHPDMGISSRCMVVLNNLMNDMFERLASEASKLVDYTGRMTLSSREIQGAVKLILPGELGKHAMAEGVKAVNNYTTSHHG